MPRFKHTVTGSLLSVDEGVGRQLGPEFELVVAPQKDEAPEPSPAPAPRSRTARKSTR